MRQQTISIESGDAMTRYCKTVLIVFCISCLSFAGTLWAAGPEAASVEQQIKMLKKQMEQMQKKMEDLQSQLENAKQDAAQAQQQAEKASQEMQRKMAEVSGKFKVLDDLSKKFSHIKLGGYVRSRWWEGQKEQNSFDVTEIAFQLRYDVSENISGEFHIWWHPSGNTSARPEFGNYANWAGPTTFFESAFAEFRNLNIGPIEGKLIVGKTRNQAFGIVPAGNQDGRVTSDYSLLHYSLNISRITGIQYLTKYKNFRWNFAVFNGWGYADGSKPNAFGSRRTNEGEYVRFLRVAQLNLDDNNHKAFSTRLAYVVPKREFIDKLEIGATYFHQKLSKYDLANINSIMGLNPGTQGNFFGDPTNKKSDWKAGLDLAYDYNMFTLKAEYFNGSVAGIDGNWWHVMPGLKFKKFKTDVYLRYAQATYKTDAVPDIRGSGSWDKSEWTPLIIYHLHERAKLYFEYYFEKEDGGAGRGNIDNNFGFVELILFY